MKPPPLLLGAGLLFWGWRTDFLTLAGALAILLELPLLFKGRWNFTDKEFNRLWDICTLLFVAAGIFLRYSEEITNAAYKFFQWFPLVFFPMAFGFVYSSRETIPIKVFSWFMRQKGRPGADKPMPFGWMYFAACLVTSGASNTRDIWFFIGIVILTGWALWSTRPPRLALIPWMIVFLLISGAAYLTQSRLEDLQGYFEARLSELFIRFGRRDFDPYESKTAMGRIGSLKQSSRIVMKVKADQGPVPERLRQTTYTSLDGDTWRGGGRSFENVPVETDLVTWTFKTNTNPDLSLRIIQRVSRAVSLLSVPLGTVQVHDLNAGFVETNRYAVIRCRENPALLDFQARYGADTFEVPPQTGPRGDFDLRIPENEEEAIDTVAREIKADALTPKKKISAIINYFAANYRYTTYQEASKIRSKSVSPLSHFLLESRAGHCEFFASATVLLLRHYGIPARYATGYAVQEDSRDGDSYVIRERDGHAWANAYIGGHWIEVDSTPADWSKREEKDFPFYEGLKDQWESLTFGFLEWRWLGERAIFRRLAPWLIAPLALFLAWRVFGRRMTRHEKKHRHLEIDQGADSELYLLEKKLRRSGLERYAHETSAQWLHRVATLKPDLAPGLQKLLPLHYKYRFDPLGISSGERTELRLTARQCLKQLAT